MNDIDKKDEKHKIINDRIELLVLPADDEILTKYIQHIFFNWDPFLYNYIKYNCYFWEDIINEKNKIYRIMDNVLSCFETEINYFKDDIKITYAQPGFDMNISKYSYDSNYLCDVCFGAIINYIILKILLKW